MNAEVGLTDRHLLTVGEMPGSTIELAREVTDPARRELDMVFTFEHVALDTAPGGAKWRRVDLPLPVLKANLDTWQRGLAETGWNSLYWDNHDQPGRSPASATTAPSTGWPPPRRWPRCCTCTAARRTSTRARSSG